jgi:hypothetical protein
MSTADWQLRGDAGSVPNAMRTGLFAVTTATCRVRYATARLRLAASHIIGIKVLMRNMAACPGIKD